MNCYKCKAISSNECGQMEYICASAGAGYWRKTPDNRCKNEEVKDKLWREEVRRVTAKPLKG